MGSRLITGILLAGAVLAAVIGVCVGQTIRSDSAASERAVKAERLIKGLRISTQEDLARNTPEYIHRHTQEMRQLVREDVLESLAKSKGDPTQVRSGLAKLGRPFEADWGPEYSRDPYALEASIGANRFILTGYTLRRGGRRGETEIRSFVQAYRRAGPASFEFVDETGDEMDRHFLNLEVLKSPTPVEVWLLAYGMRPQYNGQLTRMRVFAFDGRKFRTIWSPPDRLNVEFKTERDELVVKYRDEEHYYRLRRGPYTRTDRYLMSPQGIEQTSSLLGPED